MARRPKSRAAAPESQSAQGLIDALKFVSVAQRAKGAANETHCIMLGRYVAAFDGVLAAGHAIEDELAACPQTAMLTAALERCGAVYSITQLEGGLAIKSEKFRAVIPCVERDILHIPTLDAPVASINDSIKEGFQTIGSIVKDKAERVIEASIWLRSQTMVATTGTILIEYWHGLDLPPDLVIPKAAIDAICKSTKPLAKLGFSNHSVTFYFEDNSWIRTQQFSDKWPAQSVDKLLNANSTQEPIPDGLFIAVDAIEKFSEDGFVSLWAEKKLVTSSPTGENGASYECDGISHNCSLSIDHLKFIQPLAKTIDFNGSNYALYFIGDKVRGVISSRTV